MRIAQLKLWSVLHMSISIESAKKIGNKNLSGSINGESARAESLRIIQKHTALKKAIELSVIVSEYKLKKTKKQIRESVNNLLRDSSKTGVMRTVQLLPNNKNLLFYYFEQVNTNSKLKQ